MTTCPDGTDPAAQPYTGPFTLNTIAYRNLPGGTRDSNVEDTLEDYLVGVEGTADWFGGADWMAG